jgi:hypothetical protein
LDVSSILLWSLRKWCLGPEADSRPLGIISVFGNRYTMATGDRIWIKHLRERQKGAQLVYLLATEFNKLLILFGSSGRTRTYNPSVNSRMLTVGARLFSMEYTGAKRHDRSLRGAYFGEEFGEVDLKGNSTSGQ